MDNWKDKLESVDRLLHDVIEDWYERVREHYVTEADLNELGVEAELKVFHEEGNHRIKFARQQDLDVTYGIGIEPLKDTFHLVSSVNNKSEGFDYDLFVERLQEYYWRSRHEKPWTKPDVDGFAYEDLLSFEPVMGRSVLLEKREDRADIVRLNFLMNPNRLELLLSRQDLLRDLVENYTLYPLRRIYAESYRES